METDGIRPLLVRSCELLVPPAIPARWVSGRVPVPRSLPRYRPYLCEKARTL